MLAIVRIILTAILVFGICIFGIFCCLLRIRRFDNVAVYGRLFGCIAPLLGIKVEIRNLLGNRVSRSYVYISNHQNNYDMVTVSSVVQPGTITIGKRSLLWIPLFGLLYWLSGNILIERRFSSLQNVRDLLKRIIATMQLYNNSVWIFPEGTRNRGKKLLPFKTGAFYIALFTKSPIVPICVSNISYNKIKLNRWSNGLVIIEIMPPIKTDQYELSQVRMISAYCHKVMQLKINALNQEIAFRDP